MVSIIYRIRHKASGKCYVGSTKRRKGRFREHVMALDRGEHHSPYLQKFWLEYGPAAFVWEILEDCEDDERFVREQWWIDNGEASLNSSKFAVGGKLPDFGERMSRATKGKPRSDKQKAVWAKAQANGLAATKSNKPGWIPEHRIGVKDTEDTIEKRRSSRLATEQKRRNEGIVYVWINNGTRGQKIVAGTPIPDGWMRGRQPAYVEKARLRKGETRDVVARENMRKAQLASNEMRVALGMPHHNTGVQQNYCWVTDGMENKRQLKTQPIPNGWRRGRVSVRCHANDPIR